MWLAVQTSAFSLFKGRLIAVTNNIQILVALHNCLLLADVKSNRVFLVSGQPSKWSYQDSDPSVPWLCPSVKAFIQLWGKEKGVLPTERQRGVVRALPVSLGSSYFCACPSNFSFQNHTPSLFLECFSGCWNLLSPHVSRPEVPRK